MRNRALFEIYWNASRGLHEPQSIDELVRERFDAESAFAAGETAALTNLKVCCMKCYASRPASEVRCKKCGGLYVVLEEQVDLGEK